MLLLTAASSAATLSSITSAPIPRPTAAGRDEILNQEHAPARWAENPVFGGHDGGIGFYRYLQRGRC
jgi:hypothetical protein